MATPILPLLMIVPALLCVGACAPAQQEAAQAAPRAAACAAAPSTAAATSKLRHIPDENAACPDSHGLAPR